MKFTEISGCELKSLHALEISENEFVIYMRTDEGNVPVVIEGETKPQIFGTMAELTEVANQLTGVVWTPDEQYAKASFE